MMERTIEQIAGMIGAEAPAGDAGRTVVKGVSIDTRSILRDNLFVPIQGPRFNGHEYAAEAFRKGAAAALWQKDEPDPPAHLPLLYVDDTVKALGRLAQAYRSQLKTKVIGITGSNGKTSTKDILAAILGTTYRTQKTIGNLNNHLGVPLTLLRLDEDTEMAVVEMGMSGLGEIAALSAMAQPDVAIITSVSEVHLGDLPTREDIAEAKLEIAGSLKPDGLFVYNADNPLLLERLAHKNVACRMVSFGQSEQHDWHPLAYTPDERGIAFTISDPACPELYLNLLGKHQMINALAAIAAARHFGVSYDNIRRALRHVEATGMRNEPIRIGGFTVINDVYKSNPTSVRAALDTLYAMPAHKRKIVVLGDMVELGEETEAFHREIGAELDPSRIDRLFTVGSMSRLIAEEARKHFPEDRVTVCLDHAQLVSQLKEAVSDDCIVLIKGSRSLQLEQPIETLREELGAP
ncbi:UDP-N-acetylmuramoyl-tripeptide--D-alanyl-D-alanine ligase [Paenibacillus cisolokensis]|uniref:UDP-N-acetylmuramoyl-tripeptide--D-alanyl-D- alanine ligase n=1 Tax=Paenibacillus cisolokensis TaxID=1658519 RepID=UPI003D2BE366